MEGITFITPDRSGSPHRSDSATGRALDQRHIVMGHWKSQTYGRGHSQRKAIWIEPYIRGPELADMLDRRYVVR